MAGGTRDRIVNTNGGGGGGSNVTIVGLDPSIDPLPVDDAAAQALISALTAAITGGLTITSIPEVEIKNDAGNPVPVSATDLDVRDLNSAQDDVSAKLYAGGAAVPDIDGLSNTEFYPQDALGNTLIFLDFIHMFNGATWDRIRGDATDGLLVNLGANNDVTISGPVTAVSDAEHVEDTPHVTGDTGIQGLGVRNLTQVVLSDTNGDYTPFAVSATGNTYVEGAIAPGGTITTRPVLVAGTEGTIVRTLATDTSGRQVVVGPAADGAAVAGNPVRVAGKDGSGNTQDIATDTSGNLILGVGTNNIGDVDVVSVVPGTGATNLGKAEDGAHTSGDVGVMALGVNNDDTSAVFTATTGDYSPIAVTDYGFVGIAGANSDGNMEELTVANGRLVAEAINGTILYSASATAATVKTAIIDNSTTNGEVTLVPAVTNKKIRILSYAFFGAGTAGSVVGMKLVNGSGGATIIPLQLLQSGVPCTQTAAAGAHLGQTSASTALIATSNTAIARSVLVSYIEVD